MRTRRAVELAVVVLLAAVVLGQALGQPLLLSYVASGSMEPTLAKGDGFVALPTALTGAPEVGDVVVYRAQRLHDGGLVTHRVVDKTEHGYITKGDANPFTDQDGPEPPVPRSRIVAVALEVGGGVLVLPNVGTALMAAQDAIDGVRQSLGIGDSGGGAGLVVFGLGVVVYALSLGGSRARDRSRRRSREGVVSTTQIALGVALLVVLPATATMVAPAGAHTFEVVSSQAASSQPSVVQAGESADRLLTVRNTGTLPVASYLEPTSEGVAVGERRVVVPPGEQREVTVTVRAPAETGYYVRTMQEYRYLLVLPLPVVDALYGIHPWAPIFATDALLAGAFALVAWAALGRTRIRMRRRSRSTRRS